MIEGFDVKDQALGTGDNKVYTFDFKIFDKADLLIYVQDLSNGIVQTIRGDDTTYLSGVVFDSIKGGGTVTLVNNLDDGFTMTFMLAPDFPAQPTSFPNKTSFTLDAIEGGLDYLATLIQRIAWVAQRSMRMHDLDDIDNFNPTLPVSIASYPGGLLSVKQDGSGFEVAYSTSQIGAGSAGFFVVGTRAVASVIAAVTGVVLHSKPRELQFVKSSGGAVVVSANPQVQAGSSVGQELLLIGTDNSNTLQFTNGNGLELTASCTLSNGNKLALCWDGTKWTELYRS